MKEEDKKNYLEYNIDAPIKKAVVGLSLLGFETIFSCCGFNYDGQDEYMKKDHIKNMPYIYLKYNPGNFDAKLFMQIMNESGWKIEFVHPNTINFFGVQNDRFPWSNPSSPHNYELPLLNILRLNSVIKTYLIKAVTTVEHSVVIRDGNRLYPSIYWQQKPKIEWVVSRSTFDSIPE